MKLLCDVNVTSAVFSINTVSAGVRGILSTVLCVNAACLYNDAVISLTGSSCYLRDQSVMRVTSLFRTLNHLLYIPDLLVPRDATVVQRHMFPLTWDLIPLPQVSVSLFSHCLNKDK